MTNFTGLIANVLSIFMNIFNIFKTKLKKRQLFIDNIQLANDQSLLPGYFFLDLAVVNNSQVNIAITKASISLLSGSEYFSNADTDIKYCNVQMADSLPLTLKPDDAKRLVIEFENNDRLAEVISQIVENPKKKLVIRLYTNRELFVANVNVAFPLLEDWLWNNKERRLHNNKTI